MGSALLVLAILTLATLNMGQLLESARVGHRYAGLPAGRSFGRTHGRMQPRLMAIPGVQQVAWISPATALAQFKESLGEDAEIMDLLDSNPLPASYHLTLTPEARNPKRSAPSGMRSPSGPKFPKPCSTRAGSTPWKAGPSVSAWPAWWSG